MLKQNLCLLFCMVIFQRIDTCAEIPIKKAFNHRMFTGDYEISYMKSIFKTFETILDENELVKIEKKYLIAKSFEIMGSSLKIESLRTEIHISQKILKVYCCVVFACMLGKLDDPNNIFLPISPITLSNEIIEKDYKWILERCKRVNEAYFFDFSKILGFFDEVHDIKTPLKIQWKRLTFLLAEKTIDDLSFLSAQQIVAAAIEISRKVLNIESDDYAKALKIFNFKPHIDFMNFVEEIYEHISKRAESGNQ